MRVPTTYGRPFVTEDREYGRIKSWDGEHR
jgi:hypothetical protein